ncbi:Sec-independent protein translocase protein TatB [Defluviimonas sp. WL0024]|uniref:Sec-independent protein translocase protein TatB n=1 Tax=Albidovulum salinarum TaxID=2984153 RepID=A0ABT2WZI8_9RHOB|nr:Sec-independent protein translocase protein TatB [Defluviimonas sp. WL0024]MCU9847095.1 Sec-independent protein translocase protein TatB [Defluviimonas sp. WL0024]
MLDIGWSELLLIGIVALIVVGPKDLPAMFRTLGRFTAKARAMGREFQRAMDDAARETGVKETADELKAMTTKKSLGLDALEQAASKFEKWQPTKPAASKGPATQALADKKAADAAARTEAKSASQPAAEKPAETKLAETKPAAPKPAATTATKVPAKPKPKTEAKPAAKPKPKTAAAKAKPATKKGEA